MEQKREDFVQDTWETRAAYLMTFPETIVHQTSCGGCEAKTDASEM